MAKKEKVKKKKEEGLGFFINFLITILVMLGIFEVGIWSYIGFASLAPKLGITISSEQTDSGAQQIQNQANQQQGQQQSQQALPSEPSTTTPQQTPTSELSGEWVQTNSGSEEDYHAAYISGNQIEVFWIGDSGDTTATYWVGTYTPPNGNGSYSWESENTLDQSTISLMASSDPTKTFTYDNGVISYSTSALGITTTIYLEQKPWGYNSSLSAKTTQTTQNPTPEQTQVTEQTSQSPPNTLAETQGSKDESPTVYVSDYSNTIHSVSDCSGMKNYRTMTQNEANSKGYEYCDNCW